MTVSSNIDLEELKKLTTLTQHEGGVYVMTMHFKSFSPNAVHSIHMRLDELEKVEGPIALITVSDHKKLYSGGLDFMVFTLKTMEIKGFLWLFNSMLARLLQVGYPTIACMNGHAYAAGFMFAMAHDFRFMREDYGNCCVSEINIGAVLPRGMAQLIKDKIRPDVVRDLVIFGFKFNAKECEEKRIVDQCLPMDKLMPTCMSMAKTLAPKSYHRRVMSQIKSVINQEAIKAA